MWKDFSTNHISSFHKHISYNHDETVVNLRKSKIFHCDICNKNFGSRNQLKRHVDTSHNLINVQRPFTCDSCNKSFKWNTGLNRHVKSVHQNNKSLHQCESCKKICSRNDVLQRHIREIHHGIKAFECGSCDQKFTYKYTLEVHINSHHKSD